MRIFWNIYGGSFDYTEDGRIYYYPWRRLGKGYELRSEAQRDRLRRFGARFSLVIVLLFFAAIIRETWPFIAALLPLTLLVYALAVRRELRGLTQVPARLTFRQSCEAKAKRLGALKTFAFLVVSIGFVALALFGQGDNRDWAVILLCTVFFGACTVMFAWMLLLLSWMPRRQDTDGDGLPD